MTTTQKSKQNGNVGHDVSYPRETLGNKMVRPNSLHPYNTTITNKTKIYYKLICNTSYKIFLSFLGNNR